MSDLGERIANIRKTKLKMTQKQFTDAVNNQFNMKLSRNMLSNWECGKQKPNIDVINAISEISGMSTDYFLKGCLQNYDIKTPLIKKAEKIKKIDDIYTKGEFKSVLDLTGKKFFYKMQYDNMVNANIKKGDHILFNIQNNLENGDIGVFLLGGIFMIKRYYIKDNQTILLNECVDCEPIIITKRSNFKILGRAIKIIKDL